MSQSKGEVSKKNEYNHYDDDQASHCVGNLHQQRSIIKGDFFGRSAIEILFCSIRKDGQCNKPNIYFNDKEEDGIQ
jgi:hypothetical protein